MGQAYGIHRYAYEKWVEAKDLEVGTCYRMGSGDNGQDYYGKVLKRSAIKKGKGLSGDYVLISWENRYPGKINADVFFMECPCRRKRNKTKKRKTR